MVEVLGTKLENVGLNKIVMSFLFFKYSLCPGLYIDFLLLLILFDLTCYF